MVSPTNLVIPLTGDPTGIVPPTRPEDAAPDATLTRLYPYDFTIMMRLIDPQTRPTISQVPWAQGVHLLQEGVTIKVSCREPVQPTRKGAVRTLAGAMKRTEHELRFHPDGHITMLNHPEYTQPHGGHSSHLHLETELFLRSLGAGLDPCVEITLALVGSQHDPSGSTTVLVPPLAHSSLYAAVAWAQRPVWPNGAWERFLAAGTTPKMLAFWLSNGWTLPQAVPFLRRRAPFHIAEQWRAVGDFSGRAARLAGNSEVPGDEDVWVAAGFAPQEADRWRTFKNWATDEAPTPDEAWYWHSHGVMPNSVSDFKKLPKTEAEAATATPLRRGGYNPSLPTALAWAKAGIPSELVLSWYRTVGDDLEAALAWCRKVPAMHYETFKQWNNTHPETPITPEVVVQLRRTGVPYKSEIIGPIVAAGLTFQDVARPLSMMVTGKRWLGLQARAVLGAAILQARAEEVARQEAQRPVPLLTLPAGATVGQTPTPGDVGQPRPERKRSRTTLEIFTEAVETDNWALIAHDLRNPYSTSSLWPVYVDWLLTHPTPPEWIPRKEMAARRAATTA